MPQTKTAGDDDLAESSQKKRRVDTGGGGGTLDLIMPGDLYQDTNSEERLSGSGQSVWSELSEEVTERFSRNVVSIAVSDGHKVLFACSGIPLQRRFLVTCFLTSSSLVRAYYDKKKEGHASLKIEVRRNGDVAKGLLGDFDFDQEIALVNVMIFSLGVHPVDLNHQKYRDQSSHGLIAPIEAVSTHPDRSGDLDSWSYPKPSAAIISEGLQLVNTFEQTFGDPYGSGEGVWSQLSKTVSKNLSRVVVSLGSYSGETRFFACTGLFIEWNGCTIILTSASLVRDPNDGNKTAENLKIKVLLPSKQHKEGLLQHFSLHYNVALVGVKDFRPLRSFRILEDRFNYRTRRDPKVVAVGRCFTSGILMATCGKRTDWSGMLDYSNLRYSSCKITKVGIGGPLVDFSGRFIGMNFYDKKIGTPFMFRDCIIRVLALFEGKRTVDKVRPDGKPIRTVDEFGSDGAPVRWPVPIPCWRRQNDEDEDSLPLGHELKCGPFGFTYVGGVKVEYH